MALITRKTSTEKTSNHVPDDENKSHANDPCVIKKVNKARETLKRIGLPDVKK